MKDKPILLVGYYGADNFGDEIILKMYLSQNPNNKYFIFSNGKNYVEDNVLQTFLWKKNSKLKNLINFLKVLFLIDEIFWVGGTCFSDEDGDGLFKFMLIGRIFFKKINYKNIGINNLKKPINIFKLKILLFISNHFTFRDYESYNIAKNTKLFFDKNNNLCSKITMDLGEIFLNSVPINMSKENNLLIAWRVLSRYIKNEEVLINQLVETVTLIYNQYSKIIIVETDSTKDALISKTIFNKLSHLPNISYKNNISLDEKISIINNSRCIITSRLHIAIAGSIFNAITFVYNYADKISFYKRYNKDKINFFDDFSSIQELL